MAEHSPPAGASRAPTQRRRRLAPWLWAGLALLVALAVILFDWNMLRGPIGRYASERTGRTVVLAGDLKVHPFSLTPSARVEDLRISQPRWAGRGDMAQVGALEVSVRLLPLLRGDVVLPRLALYRPRLVLARDARGRANWTFAPAQAGAQPARLPPIQSFVIQDGSLSYDDTARKLSLKAKVEAHEAQADRRFRLTGDGALNGARFSLEVEGGALINVRKDHPYPFEARVQAGRTRMSATGTVQRPFDLGRFRARIEARGADLAELYPLLQLALPNTPPYRLSGRLERRESLWILEGMNGEVGDSDLAGQVRVDVSGERPFLRANLTSRQLDFDDLASLFGGAPDRGRGETVSPEQASLGRKLAAERRLLPDTPLDLARIRAMDADVRYHARSIRAPGLPLRAAELSLALRKGVLVANPVRLELTQGDLAGRAELDASGATPVTRIDVSLSRARLETLIPAAQGAAAPLAGPVSARARLTGRGASVRRAAANASGELILAASDGEIRKAFAELLGINVVRGLGLLLDDDESRTQMRCAYARFSGTRGVLRAPELMFDTTPVRAEGSGEINLRQETLSLRVKGEAKKARLVRLLAPVTLKGRWTAPKPGIEAGPLVVQAGAAAALGAAVAPLAAVIPFIAPGLAEDADCDAIRRTAASSGAKLPSPANTEDVRQ